MIQIARHSAATACRPLLFLAFLVSALFPAKSEQTDSKSQETSLTVGTAMVFWGSQEALVWSEGTGYIVVERNNEIEAEPDRAMATQMMEINGKWNGTGTFKLEKSTALEEPLILPPAKEINPLLADDFTRVTCEGVVLHRIDRRYMMELVVNVDGQRVGVLFQDPTQNLRHEIQPGKRIRITGHIWTPFSHPAPIPTVISCMQDGVEMVWRAPWPNAGKGVEYDNMIWMGRTSTGEFVFSQKDNALSICMDLTPFRLVDWGFPKNHAFKIKLTPHKPTVNGTIHGRSSSVVDTGLLITAPCTINGSKSKPQVGLNVRVTGRLEQFERQDNGDMWLYIAGPRSQKQSKVICKNFNKTWPGLELRENASLEVTGLCQNIHQASGHAEIVVWNRGDLYAPKTGRNWAPFLWTMAALLTLVFILSFLWVTMLRRLIRVRTREVEKSRTRLMAVYRSVPFGIVAVDRHQRIFGKNQALANMFDLPQAPDRVPFSDLCEGIGGRMLKSEAWEQYVATEGPRPSQEFTIKNDSPPGKIRSIEVQVTPIIDKQEEGEIWLFRDLTEQRELERTLAQARKLQAVGRLTGGIAHDFNNLLTGMIGNLSMLDMELDGGNTENLRDYVKGASTAADHAAQLVHQLLDFSKQTRLNIENVSANDILTNVYDIIRHSIDPNTKLHIHLADDLLTTRADPVKIERVLMNLVMNALAAEGDTVEVRTANAHLPNGRQAVNIIVSDNGCGIAPEVMDKIFDPYFTTKADKGTGLGLSSSLAIVEQHGGKLLCRSSEGIGTTFEVLLPTIHTPIQSADTKSTPEENYAPDPQNPTAHTKTGHHHSVVAIDDQPEILKLFQNMLSHLGHDVACFSNGLEALEHIHTMNGDIDLIISDNAMPLMNGMETYGAVRSTYPDIPFIVCSGYLVDLDEYGQQANGSLPEAFIPKPLHVDEFNEVVTSVLDSSQTDQ